MALKIAHVRKAVSYVLLAKGIIGGAFAVMTMAGVTLPLFGIELTHATALGAAGGGGLLGALLALRG